MAESRLQQVKADLTNLCNLYEALAALGARPVPDPQLAQLCARMGRIARGLEAESRDQELEHATAIRRTSRQRNPRGGIAHPKPTTATLNLEDRIVVTMHRNPNEAHTPARIADLLRKDGWKARADSLDRVTAILRDLSANPDSGVMHVGHGLYRRAPIESISEAKQLIAGVLEGGSGHLGVGTAKKVGQILIDAGWDAPKIWEPVVDRALASLALTPDSRVRRVDSARYEFLPEFEPAAVR
ncbi:hypothetical protein [Nocardia sp. NPDC051832]|uniref:hypothetical protein n=1 Tax=Nocardia sp. NPDC051832 TaxID=3155673 RepID=UPI003428AE07